MAKQLDCTTSIESTQNNGIHAIHFGLHTNLSRLSRVTSKRKPGLVNISGMDWTTSKSKHSIQQMPYESSSLNSISGSAMIIGLNMTQTCLEHYTTAIFSNVSTSFGTSAISGTPSFDPVHLADSEGRRIYNEMNRGDWRWDTQDQLPTGATVVPAICASDKTHLTNVLGDQHARPLYLTIGNIRKDIRRRPEKRAWILFGLIPCPTKGAKNIDEACIPRLELYCLNLGNLTSVALA
jgi:hypothetical protein